MWILYRKTHNDSHELYHVIVYLKINENFSSWILCGNVCVCIWMCVCACARERVRVHMYAHVHVCVCAFVCT